MKKILSLLLVLALMCGMLVSCDNAEKLIEKADAADYTEVNYDDILG